MINKSSIFINNIKFTVIIKNYNTEWILNYINKYSQKLLKTECNRQIVSLIQIIIIKLLVFDQISMKNYNLIPHDQHINSKYYLQNTDDYIITKNSHHKQKLNYPLKQYSHYPKQEAYKSPKHYPKSKSKTPNKNDYSNYKQSNFLKDLRASYQKGNLNNLNTDIKNHTKTKRHSDNIITSNNNKHNEISIGTKPNDNILRISTKSPLKYESKKQRSNILSPKNTNKQIHKSPNKFYLNLSSVTNKNVDKSHPKWMNINLQKINYDEQITRSQPATYRQNIPEQKQLEWKRIYQKIFKLKQKQKETCKKKSKTPQKKERYKSPKNDIFEELKGYLTPSSIKYLKNSNPEIFSKVPVVHQPKIQKDTHNIKLHNKTQGKDLYTSYRHENYSPKLKTELQQSSLFDSKPQFKNSFTKKKKNQSIYQNYIESDSRKKSINDSESTTHLITYQSKDITDFYITKYQSSPIQKSKPVSIKDFKIGKCRGQGKFGQVYCVMHIATTTIYALKKISKLQMKQNKMQNQLILQIKLQYFCNHPNILKLYGFFDDQHYIYLILQYMEQGTLFQNLKKNTYKKLTEMEVSRRVCQMANAITYLHDLDVAHRDIKPQNIVLSHGTGKLCDFGWATICYNRRKTYCGTFDYVAPEILQGKQYDECVDLWCLGVLTYQLLIGKVPFYNVSRKQTMKKILTIDKNELYFPSQISPQAKDFIESLVRKQPYLRTKAYELLKHSFIVKHFQLHLYK